MDSGYALACVRGAIPDLEAHLQRTRRLFGTEVREILPLESGYSFRFAAGVLDDVFRFIAAERKCCPFLEIGIAIPADSGPVWLTLTGPEGTAALLSAELAFSDRAHD